MSLPFNSGNNGIIQRIERKIYGQDAVGRISGNSTLLSQWTSDVNMALDKAYSLIFEADGRWQFDDANHDGNPTVTADLVDGQRAYDFLQDTEGNMLLDILRVYFKNGGVYELATPVDETLESPFFDGQSAEGTPYRYGKKGSVLLVDPIPNSNITNGIKAEVSREGSYFTTSDTTKKAGFDGLLHDFLVIEPCYQYALTNSLASLQGLSIEKQNLEKAIQKRYSRRSKDESHVMRPKKINFI